MNPIYIFDLDGTLALHQHRLPLLLEKKDHAAFEKACTGDIPNLPVIAVMEALHFLPLGFDVWFVTARSDAVWNETVEWLQKNTNVSERYIREHLVMRRAGDHRPDDVVKLEWLQSRDTRFQARIACVFEDRNRVVKMWRSRGITCFQVAEGKF